MLVKATISNNNPNIEFVPIVGTTTGTPLTNKVESDKILTGFHKRSEEIQQEGFVEEAYNKFARESLLNYLRQLYGFGKWKSRIDRKLLNGMLLKRKSKKDHMLGIQNYVECEAHRELLLQGIRNEVYNFE